MLSRKFFENLHTVMAILVVFEQFSSKFCLYFWPLILSASPNNYGAFCLHSFDYACLRLLKHIAVKRVEIKDNFCSSKSLLKWLVGGGKHPPHPPLDPPLFLMMILFIPSLITNEGDQQIIIHVAINENAFLVSVPLSPC